MLGQEVYKERYTNGNKINDMIDLTALPKGIYTIEVTGNIGKEVRKVVLN